jgi:hypothetical protein
MSYQLISNCGICKKKNKCSDGAFIYGALCGIHSNCGWDSDTRLQVNKGHLGHGTVDLNCNAFEEIVKTE